MTPDELLTPERIERSRETQDLRRERMGSRVLKDPAQIKFRWGVQHELNAYNQLLALRESGRTDVERENSLLNQVACGKAAQGKFTEAAAISTDEIARAEFEAKARAIEQPGILCDCPQTIIQRQAGNAKGREVPTLIPVERIWTGQETVIVLQCSQCAQYSTVLQRQQE